MELGQFAIAVGASRKWVQNTGRILELELEYAASEARLLGLVKRLADALDVPLARAWELADQALAEGTGRAPVHIDTSDAVVTLSIDVHRYLSDFTGRLSRALAHYEPRRRGRPPADGDRDAVERANEYGIDTTLLDESLSLTPGERLRRLDENRRFVEALRSRDAA